MPNLATLHVQRCMHMILLLMYLPLSFDRSNSNQTKGHVSAVQSELGCLSVCIKKKQDK